MIPDEYGKCSRIPKESATVEQVKPRHSLAALQTDYRFFNHGALFQFAGMRDPEDDPLADWYAQQGDANIRIIRYICKQPIISGLTHRSCDRGEPTWGQLVLGVRHEYWQSLHEFLCGVVVVDRNRRKVYETVPYTGNVADAVTGLVTPDTPLVTLTIYGINGPDYGVRAQFGMGTAKLQKVAATPGAQALQSIISQDTTEQLAARANPALASFVRRYNEQLQRNLKFGIAKETKHED